MTSGVRWRVATPLLSLLVVAAVIRAALVPQIIIHQPDEVWQYLEPAYGLVTGRWIVAWEFHAGIRTWLLPVLLSAPLALGHALAPNSLLHLLLTRGALAVLSLGVVASFYALARLFGRTHALIAGLVAATWCETVYFASSALSDAVLVSAAIPAVWVLSRVRAGGSARMAALAGLLLGLCFSIRFQMGPALLVLAIWGCGLRLRQAWLPLVVGGVAGLMVDGLADIAAGQTPFIWIARNVAINLMQGKASSFGVEPAWWYLRQLPDTWGLGAPVIVILALLGARRFPMLLLAAVTVVAVHSLIPHKEYRFVFLASALVMFLAAVGTADAVEKLGGGNPARLRAVTIGACVMWCAFSAAAATSEPFKHYWGAGRGNAQNFVDAGRTPGVCGIAAYRSPYLPDAAYVFANRPVPIYLFEGDSAEADARANSAAFNVVTAPLYEASHLPGYRLTACTQPARPGRPPLHCLFVRPGGCTTTSPAFDYNRVLTASGK